MVGGSVSSTWRVCVLLILPHACLCIELDVLCLLVANHDGVDQVEVQQCDHVIHSGLEERVTYVAVHDVQALATRIGVPAVAGNGGCARQGDIRCKAGCCCNSRPYALGPMVIAQYMAPVHTSRLAAPSTPLQAHTTHSPGKQSPEAISMCLQLPWQLLLALTHQHRPYPQVGQPVGALRGVCTSINGVRGVGEGGQGREGRGERGAGKPLATGFEFEFELDECMRKDSKSSALQTAQFTHRAGCTGAQR